LRSYPDVLPARDRQHSLTIYNTAAGSHGLSVGLVVVDARRGLAVAYFLVRLSYVFAARWCWERTLLENVCHHQFSLQ